MLGDCVCVLWGSAGRRFPGFRNDPRVKGRRKHARAVGCVCVCIWHGIPCALSWFCSTLLPPPPPFPRLAF